MPPRTTLHRAPWGGLAPRTLGAAAGLALLTLAPSATGPREAAFLQALERVHGPASPACRAALARAGPLPRAEVWAELGSLHWPHLDGPRETLLDRVDEELERRDPARACARSAPRSGGRRIAVRGGFSLEVPTGWTVHAGSDWLLARSPQRDVAVEVLSFPSTYSPRALAARSRALLERQRRVEARVREERAHEVAGAEAETLQIDFESRGREVPVRATWVRLDGRVARVLGVAELAASWRDPDLTARLEASLRAEPVGDGVGSH